MYIEFVVKLYNYFHIKNTKNLKNLGIIQFNEKVNKKKLRNKMNKYSN